MPWENKTVEYLREEFVIAARTATNFSSLCREFGISRKTGYKWTNRDGFADLPKTPKSSPTKVSKDIEDLILLVRRDNMGWGAKKIHQVLTNQGYPNLPCVKTFNNILKRNNCIEESESLKHIAFIRFQREFCNEMWQTDFKGHFALGDGTRCHALNIIDDCSRYAIKIHPKPDNRGVMDTFRLAFEEFGMPKSILSDNGSEFAGSQGGYNQFEKWLMNHNILPIHGRIMHPQTQGKIERFHRSMKSELLKFHEFYNLEHANQMLQEWRDKYNNIRPHEALNMLCPADVYNKSEREYVNTVEKYEYGGNYPVAKVNCKGYVVFTKGRVYLSETMAGEDLELQQTREDILDVYYRNFRIAEFDLITNSLLNRKIYKP